MQLIFGLQIAFWMLLLQALEFYVKVRFPDSTPGRVLAAIS